MQNRLCTVCLGNRKAEIINKYLPVVSSWSEPHFLTLTVKSIPKKNLQAVIKNMKQAFRKILNTYNKRNLRGKGEKLVGLMSIECNFNPITKTYNPHLHIITNNRKTGEILLAEWLKRGKKKNVNAKAQLLVKVKNNKDCLIEIVKYGSKILTENDLNKKASSGKKVTIYLKALYTIIEAFEGIRLFEHFGFKLMKKPNKEAILAKIAVDFREFNYDSTKTDWVDIRNKETLTGFISDQRIQHILENCIDTESS
ncbi:MAG: protein rep [Bacteroidetes bacterium]|nr:protein rep [Bacteroidota bacterium]